jgi:GntR family transcriptional regulator, arabinose operon transcriptional repressor
MGQRPMEKRLLTLDLRRGPPGRAKHERLRDHLVGEMLSGRLRPGQALPSERQLVETLGVAHMTIRQALASLENEGLIRRVQGKGTFVHDDARRKLSRGLDLFALIVPETRAAFYPSLVHGFETAAAKIHHQTIICSTADDIGQQANIILQLLDKKVGGVAINPTGPAPTPAFQIRQLQERGIPVVFCHHPVEGIAAPLLAIPYREIGRRAGNALVERGHRRLLFLGGLPCVESQVYEDGFREAAQAGGSDVRVESVHFQHQMTEMIRPDEAVCRAAIEKVLSKPDRPTGIFVTFDREAEIIYLLLPRLGLRVPEDVSLLGFGGAWREGAIMRRLNSIVVDEVDTGRRAVSLLHEMRRGERPIDHNSQYMLSLGMSDGETLGPPPSNVRQAS